MTDAVFVPDGDTFVPTERAQGPWDPDAMHGSAPAGLLAQAMERCEPMSDGMFTRIGIDLLAPVPIAPVTVRARLERPGKRVQVLSAELSVDDRVLVRASGLRIRRAPLDLDPPDAEPMPPPEQARPADADARPDADRSPHGFISSVDLRYVEGGWEPGPAKVWIRLRVPLVAGEEPSPVVRAVCAAEFASGIAAPLPFEGWLFINPDLNVHLHREPEGEWIGHDASCVAEPHGVGQSDSRLYDVRGPIGRGVQSLFVDRR